MKRLSLIIMMVVLLAGCNFLFPGCAVTKGHLPVPVVGADGKTTMADADVLSIRFLTQVGLTYNPTTGLSYGSDASQQTAAMMQIMQPLISAFVQTATKYYTGQTLTTTETTTK